MRIQKNFDILVNGSKSTILDLVFNKDQGVKQIPIADMLNAWEMQPGDTVIVGLASIYRIQ